MCYGVAMDVIKDTNPKDAVGIKKAPLSVLPWPPLFEAGLGLLEGARKYGRHNYRAVGIRNSVYFDATMRHLTAWWEGEDIDPDSGLNHITKALTSLLVLRDAQLCDMATDDRPPRPPQGFVRGCNKLAAELIEKYPDAPDPYTHHSQVAELEEFMHMQGRGRSRQGPRDRDFSARPEVDPEALAAFSKSLTD